MKRASSDRARIGAGALVVVAVVLAAGWSARRGAEPSIAAQPALLSCERTIRLRHAEAVEVAATLNRILATAHRKSFGVDCVLPAPIDVWLAVSTPTSEPRPAVFEGWIEVDPELLEPPPSGVCEECDGTDPVWRRSFVHFRPGEWPTTLRAVDGRTLAVLHGRRDEEFFACIREYVAVLDVPPVAD